MLEETRSCTLCGPTARKRLKYAATFAPSDVNARVFSARRIPDRVHFRLVTCEQCGIIFSDPACPPEHLERLYKSSTVDYHAQEEEIYQAYEPVLDRALLDVASKGVFVEIGGGSGFMLRYGVERRFASQVEIEPSTDAAARFVPPVPSAKFIAKPFQEGLLKPNSVSMMSFFQVLDHAPDPLQFVRDVFTALEVGGVAVGILHNTAALSAKLLGERSPIYDIAHTYLFNTHNVELLFKKAGFSGICSMPMANAYGLAHWLKIAPLPLPLRHVAARLAGTSRLGKLRIKVYAGNMAVIARKTQAAADTYATAAI